MEIIFVQKLLKKYLMNTTTLKKTFKDVYGTSIAQHMKQHRMEQAAVMLGSSQTDIAGIAKAVGYESPSRFTAAFKDTYGILPTEYRKQRRTQ